MPLSFPRSIIKSSATTEVWGSIVDSQATASRCVAGSTAFKFAGYDTSNNPVFLLATRTSNSSAWYYRAAKYTWSTDAWSFGTELQCGSNTNQSHGECATPSTGYNNWGTPASGSTLDCVGAEMGGSAGSQDNIDVFRLQINTSTLALTK